MRCPKCGGKLFFETENGINRDVCEDCFYVVPEGDDWYIEDDF